MGTWINHTLNPSSGISYTINRTVNPGERLVCVFQHPITGTTVVSASDNGSNAGWTKDATTSTLSATTQRNVDQWSVAPTAQFTSFTFTLNASQGANFFIVSSYIIDATDSPGGAASVNSSLNYFNSTHAFGNLTCAANDIVIAGAAYNATTAGTASFTNGMTLGGAAMTRLGLWNSTTSQHEFFKGIAGSAGALALAATVNPNVGIVAVSYTPKAASGWYGRVGGVWAHYVGWYKSGGVWAPYPL